MLFDEPQQVGLRNLIFQAEVVEQRFRAVVLPHHDQQASDDQNQTEHGRMLPSNMLLLNLILLIDVTFSTPTGDYTNYGVMSMYWLLSHQMRCGIVLRLPNYLSVDLNPPENRLRIDKGRDGEQSRKLEQVPCFGAGEIRPEFEILWEICHGKQAHADIAEIDAETIQLGRFGEYLHGGVQQLAFPASPIWFEGAV